MSTAMATKSKSSSVTYNAATRTATVVHANNNSVSKAADNSVPPFSEHLRHFVRAAVAVLVGYTFAGTAWRVRHQPQDLAFVVAAAILLAALFACLRRAERLAAPDSPAGERRLVQAAVWALSTALSCAFAYRVAAVMPPPLAVLVWCMTAFVALTGLYLLVLCRDQQYQALPGDGGDDAAAIASDRKASAKMNNPTDELV